MASVRHNSYDLTFAKRLEQAMIEKNIYPSRLAKLSGVPRSSIYNYIAGTAQPTAFNIKRLAITLDKSADWLLGIEKNSPIK